MATLLMIGAVLVGITFVIHAVGSTWWIGFLISRYTDHDGRWRRGSTTLCLISTGVFLLALHIIEVIAWAVTYRNLPGLDELKTFEEATYFSLVTFTTLGYGEITLGPQWRLLSGIEAMNGILIAGWSTALLFVVVQRSWRRSHHKD